MKNIKLNNEISQIRNRRKYLIFALLFVICVTLQMVGLPPQTANAEVAPSILANTETKWAYPTADPTTPFVGSVEGSLKEPGTAANPYAIDCEQRLADLAYFVNDKGVDYSGKFFKLTRDLDFRGSNEKQWTPIGQIGTYPFNGTFDGDGFSISGIFISKNFDAQNIGLFGNVIGTIRNLNVVNSTDSKNNVNILDADTLVTGSPVVGGIVGSLSYNGRIINCLFNGSVTIDCKKQTNAAYLGGICGYSQQGQIINCINYGTVTVNTTEEAEDGNSRVIGGICGQNKGQIINCVNAGEVNNNFTAGLKKLPKIYIGGVCGATTTTLDSVVNCYYNSGQLSNNAITIIDGSPNKVTQILADVAVHEDYAKGVKSSSSFTNFMTLPGEGVGMRDDNRVKYNVLITALNTGSKYYNIDDRALKRWMRKNDAVPITITKSDAAHFPDYKIQIDAESVRTIDGVTWYKSLTICLLGDKLLADEMLSDKYVGIGEIDKTSLKIYSSSTANPKTIRLVDRNDKDTQLDLTYNIDGTAPTITPKQYTSGSGISGYAVTIVDNETGVDWNTCLIDIPNKDQYIGYFVSADGKQIFFASGDGNYRIRISDRYGNEKTLQLPPQIN